MQLKIEKGIFKDYSLEDISDALRKGLSENFKNVEVEVVECPNLRDWDCPSEGISGNQKIIDVGGEPYMHDPKLSVQNLIIKKYLKWLTLKNPML